MYLKPEQRAYIEDNYFNGSPIPDDLEDFLDCRYGMRLLSHAYENPFPQMQYDIQRYLEGKLPIRNIRTDNLIEENRRLREIVYRLIHEMEIPVFPLQEESERIDEYTRLITMMIVHIQDLTKQVVALRYVASWAMEDSFGETIRSEIFSDLSGDYLSSNEYMKFVEEYYEGQNPLEDPEYRTILHRLSYGNYIKGYPFNYACLMKESHPSRVQEEVSRLLRNED